MTVKTTELNDWYSYSLTQFSTLFSLSLYKEMEEHMLKQLHQFLK